MVLKKNGCLEPVRYAPDGTDGRSSQVELGKSGRDSEHWKVFREFLTTIVSFFMLANCNVVVPWTQEMTFVVYKPPLWLRQRAALHVLRTVLVTDVARCGVWLSLLVEADRTLVSELIDTSHIFLCCRLVVGWKGRWRCWTRCSQCGTLTGGRRWLFEPGWRL